MLLEEVVLLPALRLDPLYVLDIGGFRQRGYAPRRALRADKAVRSIG